MKRKIFISTTNDITTDNRVNKVAVLLQDLGYEVKWIGRELATSKELNRDYGTDRMKLWFTKGGLFYAEFQVRLFLKCCLNATATRCCWPTIWIRCCPIF